MCDKFADECNFRFVFSSPRYPQSNGLAEKGVAIAKNLLKRCLEVGELHMYQYRLLEYNTTPIASMKLSPAQLFFGRWLKTKLPVDSACLMRNCLNESEVQECFDKKRKIQRKYYNQHAKALPVLNEGDRVMFKKKGKEGNYGRTVRNLSDRSYLVADNFNNHFRRNRRFISKTNNNVINTSDLMLEEGLVESSSNVNPAENCEKNIQRMNNSQNISGAGAPSLDSSINSEQGSSLYDTAESGTESDERGVSDEQGGPPLEVRTRSGRVIKPRQMYGDWTV